jgi:hypothetical protein
MSMESSKARKHFDLHDWTERRAPFAEWRAHPHELRLERRTKTLAARDPAPATSAIDEAIEAARYLVNMPADWDEAGAEPIAGATWERATNTLREAARVAYLRCNYVLPPPRIGPCPDGSIDLYWKTGEFTLLINVQPNDAESDFYGEREKGYRLQGPFVPAAPNFDFINYLVEP